MISPPSVFQFDKPHHPPQSQLRFNTALERRVMLDAFDQIIFILIEVENCSSD